jgi:two-component system phosphate regulon response regulator OmpR
MSHPETRPEPRSAPDTGPNGAARPSQLTATEVLPDDAPHVLVVDDDHRIRSLLSKYLTNNGFRVTQAADAAAARAALKGLQFDVVILDVMMPGESGLDLARFLKSTTDVPVCMLTAQAEPSNRIEGLESGVDDYVAKPFEPRELLLRLQNIMRRGGAVEERSSDEICMGPLTFHITRGELRKGNQTIKLTERERELLRMFARRPGDSISRHELAADESTYSERAIDVQINRLRRKIEDDPSNPVYLQTVRGKGYILHTD